MPANQEKRDLEHGKDSKPKGRDFKGKGKPFKFDKNKDRNDRCSSNVIKWYSRGDTEPILKQSANFFASRPGGRPILASDIRTAFAGLMVIKYHSVVPGTFDETNAATVAARSSYSFIRHANSGHTNYEAPDLEVMLLAASDAYALAQSIARFIGLSNKWFYRNRTIPNAFEELLDFDDLRANRANYVAQFNLHIKRLMSIAIPSQQAITMRKLFLNSKVFTEDDKDPKAQLYVCLPDSYLVWDPTTYATGSALTRKSLTYNSSIKLSDLLSALDEQITALLTDEDIGIMSGDILKAFGADNLMKLSMIDTEYSVEPEFDYHALLQIQHLTVSKYLEPGDIIQNSSGVICQIMGTKYWYNGSATTVSTSNAVAIVDAKSKLYLNLSQITVPGDEFVLKSFFLTFDKEDDNTPETVMESTRLTYLLAIGEKHSTGYEVSVTCGTEIVSEVEVWSYDISQSTWDYDSSFKSTCCTYKNATQIGYIEDNKNAIEEAIAAETVIPGDCAFDTDEFLLPLWSHMGLAEDMSVFHYRPLLYSSNVCEIDTDGVSQDNYAPFSVVDTSNCVITKVSGAIDYYAVVTYADLDPLHELAVFNELIIDSAYYKA